ncbi:MAG: DUF975 domain-containing protein [Cyanobacteria bacterium J06642_3]
MKPLSVGNVVSAGLRIYRDNFKKYYRLAFIGYLWVFIPAFIVGVIGGFVGINFAQGSSDVGFSILLIAVAIVALIYGTAKFYVYQALISRLAYSETIEKPESIQDANRHVKGRMWSFLVAALLVSLRFFLAYILGALVIGLVIGGVTTAIWGLTAVLGDGGAIIGTILSVVLSIAVLVWFFSFLFRLFASYSVSELLLATQDGVTASQSLKKSRELTQGYLKNLMMIYLIASLVSFPLWGLAYTLQMIPTFLQNTDLAVYSTILTIVHLVFNFLATALIIPFWQSIKAVIYYDLKVRREGLGLDLSK